MTRIVLIRHGQTAWNREARFRGRSEIPLDELGLKQAEATARYVALRWPVVAVYASPMNRTMQTAAIIAQAQGLSAQPLEELIDVDFGAFQGLLADEAERLYPEVYRAWLEAPHTVQFPGGESLGHVRSRVLKALEKMKLEYPGQSVALVSHIVVNRVLLCAVLGLGNERFWYLGQEPCAVNVFDIEDNGDFTVHQLNDTSHVWNI